MIEEGARCRPLRTPTSVGGRAGPGVTASRRGGASPGLFQSSSAYKALNCLSFWDV